MAKEKKEKHKKRSRDDDDEERARERAQKLVRVEHCCEPNQQQPALQICVTPMACTMHHMTARTSVGIYAFEGPYTHLSVPASAMC